MSLLNELKRRKVFRVAVVYAATAFVVLQAADIMLPRLGVPEWGMSLIVLLVVLGFLGALVLAWALELTPDGVRVIRATPASNECEGGALPALLGRRTLIVAGLLVAVGAGLGAGWFLKPAAAPEPAAGSADGEAVVADKSIAVLPFADFSPGGDQAWFADGLAEEILNSLARAPDLKVASRTASFAFRGSTEDLSEIARRLGVAHVLEGSVRRAEGRLRVTAQLIRAADGYHLWSENFDGSTDDAIAVQESTAVAIARALRTVMDPDALTSMLGAGTRSVEAWEAYLHGQAILDQAERRGDFARGLEARAAFERAVAIDPRFARAHYALAVFWSREIAFSSEWHGLVDLPVPDKMRQFHASIEAAIAHAPDAPTRLSYQAFQAWASLRLARAIDLTRERVALQPDRPEPWFTLGQLLIDAGRYDEARDALLKSLDLSLPTASVFIAVAGFLHRADPEATVPLVERALVLDPDNARVIYQSHRALLHAGRVDAAAPLARRYAQIDPGSDADVLVQVRQACAEGRVADADRLVAASTRAFDWLVLKTLGRPEEARPILLDFDTPDRLAALHMSLTYPFLDVSELPLLARTLADQGIVRPPPRLLPFPCRREPREEAGR